MNKKPYVLVSDCGVLKCWPYPEVQEFCQFDLSKEVIYLTDEELKKYLNMSNSRGVLRHPPMGSV